MPLSDHEQRLLDEIEQALYAEDPKFAATVRSARRPSRTRRTAILCGLGVLLGLGLVLVGLINTKLVPLSVAGFVLVVGSCGYLATSFRSRHTRPVAPPAGNVRQLREGGLRSRMEERLRRRFDEN